MIGYTTCETCAAALTNDDYSGMDADTEHTVSAWSEAVGLLFPHATVSRGGYWDCEACDETLCGGEAFLWYGPDTESSDSDDWYEPSYVQ